MNDVVPVAPPHPDSALFGNRIVRHYGINGTFTDLSVDQTIASGLNRWRGWRCSAGVEHLYIDYDGDVWIGNCRVGGNLGNVFREFSLPEEWIECPRDFCGCGADIAIPKVKAPEYRSLLLNLGRAPRGPTLRREKTPEPVAVEQAYHAPVQVFWDLHRRCNFECSYCWPGVHDKIEPFKPYEALLAATETLFARMGRSRTVHFLFGGGEPTMHPSFLDWVALIHSKGGWSVVTTNGSRNERYLVELIRHASLNVSVHFEFAIGERWLDRIRALVGEKNANPATGGLEVKVMVPPGSVARGIAFRDELLRIPGFEEVACWSLVPVRSIEKFDELVEYDPEEFLLLKRALGLSS
ncbi:MAG: radical SAM protein [Oligoflexia bacterium]|nr:radical SAM protein [Oligoflexia bacterium]